MSGEKFIINGPATLKGGIDVRGAKNAATKILAASLLTDKECIIENLPLIEDVFRMVELLESMGVKTRWLDERTLALRANDIDPSRINKNLVFQMRSSVVLLGPILVRFRKISIPQPGGCNIGARPIDVHLNAFKDLGVRVSRRGQNYFLEAPRGLKPAKIILDEFSVTATENILMASSLIPGKTIIETAAAEPHVQDLGRFLTKMGVKVGGLGTHTITVEGKKRLRGARHFLIYDPIEAGTFIILGGLCKGKILVNNINPDHLKLFFKKLKDFGVDFQIKSFSRTDKYSVAVEYSPNLKASRVKALPYPGIPTDLQAPLGILATQARGETLIHDPLYEGRFNYIKELQRMGARAKILDPHRAFITGPVKLRGINIKSFDLRAGATLIIAAFVARGRTTISDIYQVDRGYEHIEERLQKLGANIKRV